MGVVNTIRSMFGSGAARTVLKSPWSDSTHLGDVVFDGLFGIGAEGPVSRTAAIRLAPVAKGRDVLTGMIARQPLFTSKGGSRLAEQSSFFQQPEDGRPLSVTLTWTVDALFFYGRAWWHVTAYKADGFPRTAVWVPEHEMQLDESGRPVQAFGEPINSRDVIRFDGPHEGVLWRGCDTIRRAIRLNRSAAKAEDNPVPSIDLHNEGENLTAEEVAQLTASWAKARETSGIGYSSKGLKVNVLSQPNEQLMIEGRKVINLDLARHMGAPEWAVGVAVDGSSMTYTNRQSRNGELIDIFLSPYMESIAGRLSLSDITPHGTQVKFDSADLIREDTTTRYRNHNIALAMKLYDLEYAKELEGLDPIGENTNAE